MNVPSRIPGKGSGSTANPKQNKVVNEDEVSQCMPRDVKGRTRQTYSYSTIHTTQCPSQ